MVETAVASDRPRARGPGRVILAGLLAGALDFVDASAMSVLAGKSMLRPWVGIAKVWVRSLPDKPNLPAAGLGAATHFAIAIVMAAVLAFAMRRIHLLRRRPILGGLAYGVGLYLVMLGIVMPMLVPGRFFLWNGIGSLHGIAIHVAMGLIMAIVISGGQKRTEGLPGR